jgi:hypothetical protein
MKRTLSFSKLLALLVLLGLGLGVSRRAFAQPWPLIPAPPSVVIATSEPVYYEGHPAYWHGGHWYWREGRAWHSYSSEPVYLRDHRVRRPPPRHHYEPRRR